MIKYLIEEYVLKTNDYDKNLIDKIIDWIDKNRIMYSYDSGRKCYRFNINEEQYLEFKLRFL